MKKKNTVPTTQYRQGDVLIERIGSIPTGVKKQKSTAGKVILAFGGVTGHHHSMNAKEVEEFDGPGGDKFFNIQGRQMTVTLPIVRRWKNQVMVNHPEKGMIEFSQADVTVRGNMVEIDGKFALLKHQEHSAHGIPAGCYRGGVDGKVHQREYTPQEIRRVQD